MDNSTVSTLSPPPSDIVDDMEDIQPSHASSAPAPTALSSSALSSSALSAALSSSALRHQSRPTTVSPSFIGYSFHYEGRRHTIQEKSAVRRGGRPSHVWQYGSELRSPHQRSGLSRGSHIRQPYSARQYSALGTWHCAEEHLVLICMCSS